MATSETHIHKITNLLIFYIALGLDDLMGANPLLGPLEGVGPKNLEFFVMDVPALKSLRPAPTTGTLIVNSSSTSCGYFCRPTAEGDYAVCSVRRCLNSV
jgi:hypothetical protein